MILKEVKNPAMDEYSEPQAVLSHLYDLLHDPDLEFGINIAEVVGEVGAERTRGIIKVLQGGLDELTAADHAMKVA